MNGSTFTAVSTVIYRSVRALGAGILVLLISNATA